MKKDDQYRYSDLPSTFDKLTAYLLATSNGEALISSKRGEWEAKDNV